MWNCRGLGNLVTEKELGEISQAKDPSVMFIAETWADEVRLKSIKHKLQFDHMFMVPRIHRGGGLVLYWKDTIKLNVETSSKNHIDCIIGKGSEDAWRFTGFYGEPITHKKFESWELLRQLNRQFGLPWLCCGDFNEILRGSEKMGGSNRSHAQMQLFRDTIDECGFLDMGYKGHPFTWKKFFRDGRTIAERLDRCLANNEWLVRFGGSMVHHLTCSTSDHSPLWILPENLVVTNSEKPFRFEEMWLAEKGCTDTVKAEWGKCRNNTNNPSGIVGKIENCGKALTKWSRNCFGSVRKELKHKQKLLAQAELEALTTGVNFRARML